jgi:hypothetical protein
MGIVLHYFALVSRSLAEETGNHLRLFPFHFTFFPLGEIAPQISSIAKL